MGTFGNESYSAPDTQRNIAETEAAIAELEGVLDDVHEDLKRMVERLDTERATQRKLMELDAVFIGMRDDVVNLKENTSSGIPVVDEIPRQAEIDRLRGRIEEVSGLIAELEELKALQKGQLEELRGLEKKVERWVGKWPKIQS